MKIALVYDCIYPYIKGGGEKRYYEIAKGLKDEHEVHLFGIKFWQGKDIISKDGIYYHGVGKPKKIYIKSGRRSIWQALYFGFKLLRPLFREKFNLIDCAAFPYFSVFTCFFYSKIKKSSLVITWFEYWDLKYWMKYLGVLGFLGFIIEKIVLFFSTKIISISRFTTKRLIKAGKKEKNIITIPIGIHLAEIKKVKPSNELSDLIFAGRLIREKNIDLLVKTVDILKKDFPQIKCLIIGDGPKKEKLINLTKKLHLEKNVIFKKFLETQENVYSYLKSSKIFVLPSSREGFGIVVLEANACGLPVVTTNYYGNAAQDLIKNQENGFICNFNSKYFVNKIKNIIENKELLLKLSINSKKIAENYDWSKIIKDLKKYYLKVRNENSSDAS